MEIKGEANLLKNQIEKIADKVIVGVNKENNTFNLSYQDNRSINLALPLPQGVQSESKETIEGRIKSVIDAQCIVYKDHPLILNALHQHIQSFNKERIAISMIVTSGTSVGTSINFMKTGDVSGLKIINHPAVDLY